MSLDLPVHFHLAKAWRGIRVVIGDSSLAKNQWALIRSISRSHVGLGKKGVRVAIAKGKMPPKKKGEAEGPGPLLGRFGTSLKCGIVGLPNVG